MNECRRKRKPQLQLTESLQGANEVEAMEEEGKKMQRVFRQMEKDREEFKDPTLGMGQKPTPRMLEKIESKNEEALQTDIASMEDEYE